MRITRSTLERMGELRGQSFVSSIEGAGKWGENGNYLTLPDQSWHAAIRIFPRRRGLGDVVASIAQPIAGMIDSMAGTDLKRCKGCKDRQRNWNKAVPDILHPFSTHPTK